MNELANLSVKQPWWNNDSSVSPSSERLDRSDEGLTLETSAFKLFMVANLRYQLSWLY